MATGAIVSVLVMRRSLKPLGDLAARIAFFGEDALAARIPAAKLPEEIAPLAERLNDPLHRLQQASARERTLSGSCCPDGNRLRLFESLPLVCPNCGADMRIIAFITETAPVEQMLLALGEPPRPPPITPARGPPAWDDAPEPDWDYLQQPEPDFEFDQRVAW
jgi:hypothetical protein